MIKLANAVRRGPEFIVMSYTRAPAGFWQLNSHLRRLPSDVGAAELGQALLDALDVSNDLPLGDTDRSANVFAPVLEALGLKTYAQYMKGAVSVQVGLDDDGALKITPMRNEGARNGFTELVDAAQLLVDQSPASIGAAVEEAMERAVT